MRFMIVVKASKDTEAGQMPEEKLIAAMATYHEELAKAGVLPPHSGWHSSDSRPHRIGFSCADACDLSVQPGWICIVGSLRSHLSAAIPRDTFWRRSAQPERMAACHGWRSHERI